jgi:hypothetical protein
MGIEQILQMFTGANMVLWIWTGIRWARRNDWNVNNEI